MHTSTWLKHTETLLANSANPTARLDCLILLEDELGINRAYILANPNMPLPAEACKRLDIKVKQRLRHIPLAYIRGHSEFYGREFVVTTDTLVPRPESETMIELLLGLALPRRTVIADIGTGCGSLVITAGLELAKRLPADQVELVAVDIDEACLTVARQNAIAHDSALITLHGNLLEPCIMAFSGAGASQDSDDLADRRTRPQPNVLLCNLPYVPDDYQINQAALHEPQLAIFGGSDGLDYYRRLFDQTSSLARQPQFVLCESLPEQHDALQKTAATANYRLQSDDDFIQVFETP